MKRITKDHESLFDTLKDQYEKNLYYISGHTFQFPGIDWESPQFML